MDLSSGDISAIVFKPVVKDDLGNFSLDGHMLSVLMTLDGELTLGHVAQKTCLNMANLREASLVDADLRGAVMRAPSLESALQRFCRLADREQSPARYRMVPSGDAVRVCCSLGTGLPAGGAGLKREVLHILPNLLYFLRACLAEGLAAKEDASYATRCHLDRNFPGLRPGPAPWHCPVQPGTRSLVDLLPASRTGRSAAAARPPAADRRSRRAGCRRRRRDPSPSRSPGGVMDNALS